jgi:hypothetical protein
MTDDGGVLGNLPRSRPGQRSDKRATSTPGEAARRAERSGAPAAQPAASSVRPPKPPKPPPEPPRGRDPVGGVLRAGAKVAGIGVRVAAGVAGHVLRRIPRP